MEIIHEIDAKPVDIWSDATYLTLLREGELPATMDFEESKRAKKRVTSYCLRGENIYFKGLCVPKPEERTPFVIQIHEDFEHSGEERTLAEVCRRYFWHNQTKDVKAVVRICQKCQMVRRT